MELTELPNGLTVVIEEMPHFESVAYDLHIPGGYVAESESERGLSILLSELTERGAGGLDSRGLSDAYDAIGARHGCSASNDRFLYRGNVVRSVLPEALRLLSLQIREPMLPEGEIDSIKELLAMDLKSLYDAPSRLVMVELTKQFMPHPYNRAGYATEEGLENITHSAAGALWRSSYQPKGAILSISGNCVKKDILKLIDTYFGQWKGEGIELPRFDSLPKFQKRHVSMDTAQVQIALAYPTVKFGDENYYTAKVANEILSGGMFGRLFIEVREKRGLCYSVNSRHSSGRNMGAVYAYAGTTPERAHETLTVMIEVLKGLRGTVSEDELKRAKANLKASLVIGEESPAARAGSNAGDWWVAKRIRSLAEVVSGIDAVTAKDIDAYIEQYPPTEFTLVTLGSKEVAL